MPYISSDELSRARQIDLLTYLERNEPEELVHFSGNTYTTRSHDSLKISNGKWCWWSRGIGGSTALDYLIEVRGLSLPEAVTAILGIENTLHNHKKIKNQPNQERKLQFFLPIKHKDNKRVFTYLKSRGIEPDIINYCIQRRQLYEEAQYHSCVFVGFQSITPKYGALRSTFSESDFKGEVPCSDKRFSFAVPLKACESETLCVFESAIDALSYLSILYFKGYKWQEANVLSIGGVYSPLRSGQIKIPLALEQYLKDNPKIKKIVLGLDNDEPARAAASAIKARMFNYDVIYKPPREGKDYNELLQKMKGIKREKRGVQTNER